MSDEPKPHSPPPGTANGAAVQQVLLQLMVPAATMFQLGQEAAEMGVPHIPAEYIRDKLAHRPVARLHYALETAQNPSRN